MWNAGATELFADFGRLSPRDRNYVCLLLTQPGFRALHTEWAHDARAVVASLRKEAAADPDDRNSPSSSAGSPCRTPTSDLVGDLTLDCDT